LFMFLSVEHPLLRKSKGLSSWIEKQWAFFQLAIQRRQPHL
jgi:hypothetical protein